MQNSKVINFPDRSSEDQSFEEFWTECCEEGKGHWVGRSEARRRFHASPEEYFRNAGWVYVLGNAYMMPDIYKVGMTTQPIDRRMKQLRTTGVPGSFDCLHAAWFSDCQHAEMLIHELLDEHRLDEGREFFAAPLAVIKKAVKTYARFGDIHPDHMVDHAHARWQQAVNCERVNGVLVAKPARFIDGLEVPF